MEVMVGKEIREWVDWKETVILFDEKKNESNRNEKR